MTPLLILVIVGYVLGGPVGAAVFLVGYYIGSGLAVLVAALYGRLERIRERRKAHEHIGGPW